ncbi:MAG: hypothetical protein Q8K68_10930, partial [Nitrospirota bacterium]|nr:hypothetical protein [Nitrospirota bacterium]
MKKQLVFVGGGHAHLTALSKIRDYVDRGHEVTVISASAYQYYSGMGPGMLSGIYRPQDIRFHIKKMTEDRGGVFIEDRVINIKPQERSLLLASGKSITYDAVSFNIGSEVSSGATAGQAGHIKDFKIEPVSVQKIPPNLPLSKGGMSDPSLEKRGEGRFVQSKSYIDTVSIFTVK